MQHKNNHLSGNKPQGMYLCSDVACWGNPGSYEYRVMDWKREIVFNSPRFEYGTNNIGEFLGIVAALEYRKMKGFTCPVYSDSLIAISWIKAGKCRTKSEPDSQSKTAIYFAELFLSKNHVTPFVKFWNKRKFGEEVPADYGRK